jgi:hypothetical protein
MKETTLWWGQYLCNAKWAHLLSRSGSSLYDEIQRLNPKFEGTLNQVLSTLSFAFFSIRHNIYYIFQKVEGLLKQIRNEKYPQDNQCDDEYLYSRKVLYETQSTYSFFHIVITI